MIVTWFRRLSAAIHRGSAAPPDPLGIFLPKRKSGGLGFLVVCCALPAGASELVFEGDGARMVVPLSDLSEVVRRKRDDGMNEVAFKMGTEDAERFEALTTELEGKTLEMSYCGTVLASPTVLVPIEGGSVLITGGSDLATVALFDALARGEPCQN